VPKDTEAVLDMDVKTILEEFAVLPDPRSHISLLNRQNNWLGNTHDGILHELRIQRH